MTWTSIAIAYGSMMFGFIVGWFICALFSVARDHDEEFSE